MAQAPGYDANHTGAAGPNLTRNRAVTDTYEPGSTFKLVTVTGALSDGLVKPTTRFTLPVCIQVANYCIHDAEQRNVVNYSVAQILQYSSNVGAITLAEKLGAPSLARWIDRFGFGHATGIDFPGESSGLVLPLAKWSGSTIGNVPIGQGLAVTPIQMVAAYTAIAHEGILRPPQLIKRIGEEPVREPQGRQVIKPQTAAEIRQMLKGVLAAGGTASEVSVPGYTLAGKTGTAQVAENGGYSETKFVASFIGFAPAQNPQLLAAVIVDQPQGEIYGGSVAAPAFGQIAEFALPYLGVPQE
jgi:cell division protein FtsI/penicillin-binding protein 2